MIYLYTERSTYKNANSLFKNNYVAQFFITITFFLFYYWQTSNPFWLVKPKFISIIRSTIIMVFLNLHLALVGVCAVSGPRGGDAGSHERLARRLSRTNRESD